MKKILFFSLLLLFLFPLNVSAFEDTVERYPTGAITDYWDRYADAGAGSYPSVITFPCQTCHVIDIHTIPTAYGGHYSTITTKEAVYNDTLIFTIKKFNVTSYHTTGGHGSISLTISNATSGYSASSNLIEITTTGTNTTIENAVIELYTLSNQLYLYKNGEQLANMGTAPSSSCNITITVSASGTTNPYNEVGAYAYIDDLNTLSSTIGTPEVWNELATDITYSWNIQAFQSYPSSSYKITLYSLSAENGGTVAEYPLTTQSGNGIIPRASTIDENFGIYLLELTRDSDILADQYFYYGQSASPVGLPDVLFKATSDVAMNVHDEDGNGGDIAGGGAVYLYPENVSNAPITFTLSENPAGFTTTLQCVYGSSLVDSINFQFRSLSNDYIVTVDGAAPEGSAQVSNSSWDYEISAWDPENSHTFTFSPDLTKPGVYGYIKDASTAYPVARATVAVFDGTNTQYLYTDSTGLFYLSNNISAGQEFTISATKTGYEASEKYKVTALANETTRQDIYLTSTESISGEGVYYAPHDVTFEIREKWYSATGLQGVQYTVLNGTTSIKTGRTDSKGMFAVEKMNPGTNYTISLQYNGTTYTRYVEPGLTEYLYVLNPEGVLHQYANSWLTLSYTENANNVSITYDSNKTLAGASLTAIAGNGTTVYTQTLSSQTGSFTFETGGEGDYTLNFHIEATDGSTASQSWGLSYPPNVPLFPDSYPPWLKNVLFSGIVMVFLLSFGKSKNDIACGAVAILTSMGYIFEWFTGSFYFVVLVWIIAIGSMFLHYKRTGGLG
jgi:hypothetical protein